MKVQLINWSITLMLASSSLFAEGIHGGLVPGHGLNEGRHSIVDVSDTYLNETQFCRTVRRGGVLGQPSGNGQHCVSFEKGKMTDNANSFFGNPPEIVPYKIINKTIYIQKDGKWIESEYKVNGNSLIYGAIVKLEKVEALEGKEYCRTVKRGGILGQPPGEGQHCISFEKGTMKDNKNTFFGNPPETTPYMVVGKIIFVQSNGEWTKTSYVLEGDSINYKGSIMKKK